MAKTSVDWLSTGIDFRTMAFVPVREEAGMCDSREEEGGEDSEGEGGV